jgi:uncharacterized protein (DUF2249 family)
MLDGKEVRAMALPLIRPDQTVGDVTHHHTGTLEVMQRLGINHCCGAQLTLAEAAAAAGLPIETLLEALNRTQAPPIAEVPPDDPLATLRQVHVDVRDDIRRGQEPFARIMAAVKALEPSEALAVRTPFEPIPLYGVLGKRGFAHRTERRGRDDWTVWFYRNTGAQAAETRDRDPFPRATKGRTLTIDVRGLEPPHPMVRVLEALEGLRAGDTLEVLHERRPVFLYPQLDERGFIHETDEPAPGQVRILIRTGRAAA